MNTNDKYQQRQRDPGTPVPSVGRVVHYFAYGTPGGEFPAGVPRAAIITEVDLPGSTDSPVGLCVLNPTGIFFNRHVERSEGLLNPPVPGTWDWSPYVAPIISSGATFQSIPDMVAEDQAAMSKAATPLGSIYVATPLGSTPLELRTKLMVMTTALNAIYTMDWPAGQSPDRWDYGDHDSGAVGGWFEEYVNAVRDIARKALEA